MLEKRMIVCVLPFGHVVDFAICLQCKGHSRIRRSWKQKVCEDEIMMLVQVNEKVQFSPVFMLFLTQPRNECIFFFAIERGGGVVRLH